MTKRIAPIAPETPGQGPDELLKQAAKERLAKDFGAAKQIYLAIRRDFRGTRAAAMAAFSLGRIAFDNERDYASAADWFQTYLTEHRGKTLEREALGRLMESFYKAGNRTDAAQTARQYLERYPEGPHATLARSIIND
jgi:TolA-binding protein